MLTQNFLPVEPRMTMAYARAASQSLQPSPLPTTTAMTARGRRRWWSARGGRDRDVPRPTGTRTCLRGLGRRLRQRWLARWVQQSRSVTWLPGSSPRGVVASWRRRMEDNAEKFLFRTELLKKKDEKERKGQERLVSSAGSVPTCQGRTPSGRHGRLGVAPAPPPLG